MRPARMFLETQICSEPFLMVWKPKWSQSLLQNSSPRPPLLNHRTILSPQPFLQYCQCQIAVHSCFSFIFQFLLSWNISLFLSAAIHTRVSRHGFFFLGSASLGSPCPGHSWHPQMLLSSIGSPKSAAPESVSNPFSSTSWTSSSVLSHISSLDIELSLF